MSALTSRVKEEKLIVLNELTMEEIKTKKFQAVLDALKAQKALVVLEDMNQNVILSARNIEGIKTAQVNELNTYDVLRYGTVIASEAAVKKIEEVYA